MRARRTTELTVAILQPVASLRGIAALPGWAVQSYLDRDYVKALRITKRDLNSGLWATIDTRNRDAAYLLDFINGTRTTCLNTLRRVQEFSRTST